MKEERGDLTIGKQILCFLLENNMEKSDKTELYVERAAEEIWTTWHLQTDHITFKEFDRRIIEWHNLNKLKIRSFYNNEHVRYIIKHDMGKSWSEFQCKMYCKILEKLDMVVVANDFNDLSYTIEVAHQK